MNKTLAERTERAHLMAENVHVTESYCLHKRGGKKQLRVIVTISRENLPEVGGESRLGFSKMIMI